MATMTYSARKAFDQLLTAHGLSQIQSKPLSVENCSLSDMASDIIFSQDAFPKDVLQNISDDNQTPVQHLFGNMPSDFKRFYDNLSSDQIDSLTAVYASLKSSYGVIDAKWEASTDTLGLGYLDGKEIIAEPMSSFEDIVQHGEAMDCPVAAYASGAMGGEYFIWSLVASDPVDMSTPVGMLVMRFNGELVFEDLIICDDENADEIKQLGMSLCTRLEDSTELEIEEDWDGSMEQNEGFISFMENEYKGELNKEKDRFIFLTGFDVNNDGFSHHSYAKIVEIISQDAYDQIFKPE